MCCCGSSILLARRPDLKPSKASVTMAAAEGSAPQVQELRLKKLAWKSVRAQDARVND